MSSVPIDAQPAAAVGDDERELLSRLERVAAVARKFISGEIGTSNARQRSALGQGTLFSDHRRYAAGDDLRFVDWNAYARLDEVFLRVFEPEDSAPLSILLDTSASMTMGDGGKFKQAALLASAFGAIGALALAGAVAARVPQGEEGTFQTKASLLSMLRFFRRPPSSNAHNTTFPGGVRRCAARARRGPFILITDAIPPPELDAALRAREGRAALLLHIVDPAEIDPSRRGMIQLTDPESGRSRTAMLTSGLARRYAELARARIAEVERATARANANYLRVSTHAAFDAVVIEALHRGAGSWRV
ncbi:MAG: DUF58 domain-containing protein [Planctomycetes bacterium]|nr:DUF58 domain-containing protein [Planctomycetota bacterium]